MDDEIDIRTSSKPITVTFHRTVCFYSGSSKPTFILMHSAVVENRISSRVQDCNKNLENYVIVPADKVSVGIKLWCIREPFDNVGS